MAQSRPKGQRGEREVAKLLQEWWRTLEPKATFQRSPGSGGFATSRKLSADFNLHGDIVTDAKLFPFCIEVKNREEWSPEELKRDNPKSAVWGWWHQCQRDAKAANKIPLLIFKKNRVPWNVWFPMATRIANPTIEGSDHYLFNNSIMQAIPVKPFTRDQLKWVNAGEHCPGWFSLEAFISMTPFVIATASVDPQRDSTLIIQAILNQLVKNQTVNPG